MYNDMFYNFLQCSDMPLCYRSLPSSLCLCPGESGIILGESDSAFIGLKSGAEGNVLLIGSPGSGKSSGVFIPTLLNWDGPFFAIDIKGELLRNYLSYRGNERTVIILDPRDPSAWSVDPFEWLEDDGENELLSNVTSLAAIIVPYSVNTTYDPYWEDSERAVLSAALLFYYTIGLSFSQAIIRILDLTLTELCAEISGVSPYTSDIRHLLGSLADMKNEAIASIERGLHNRLLRLSNEGSLLHFFRGHRETDRVFSFRDMDTAAIFLRIPPEKAGQWGTGVIILLTMLLRYLQRRPDQYSSAARNLSPYLLALDELPRFGNLPMLDSALATLRSKKVNILLGAQSISQLDAIYGPSGRAAIMDCCAYRAIFRVCDPQNQRLISDMLGTYPAVSPSVSLSYNFNYGYPNTAGMQVGVRDRDLIPPFALASIGCVILATPYGAFFADKIPPLSKNTDIPWENLPVSCKKEPFHSTEERSAEAAERVQAFLTGRPCAAIPNHASHYGNVLLRFFPELREGTQDIGRILRILAADRELLNELAQRAAKIVE